MDTLSEEYMDEKAEFLQGLVDKIWYMIAQEYEVEEFSEEDMLEIFCLVGMVAGRGMNISYYANETLPYQLFGILSDIAHQTIYTERYGLDMAELEQARQQVQ